MRRETFIFFLLLFTVCSCSNDDDIDYGELSTTRQEAIDIVELVNDHWQDKHPEYGDSFWKKGTYHTGNIEAYKLLSKQKYYDYSLGWAEQNLWKGARSNHKESWVYTNGYSHNHVLFADWQVCFQSFTDLYVIDGELDHSRIARAIEVMEYQMSKNVEDYWWWIDALYMAMPVMTKLYNITGDELYLKKLVEYFDYTDNLLFDAEIHLYYRDENFIYPNYQTEAGIKEFWSRGNGWVFAGLAKVLSDLPIDNPYREKFEERYKQMAESLVEVQQNGGYWTRSLLDPAQAPGYETSGTAFFTYGLLWGINNGILQKEKYKSASIKAWNYLRYTALQSNGTVGYVQPVGNRAIPGETISKNSTSDFGVGAFLLAACEMARYLD